VVSFSKTYCPFCKKVEALLKSLGIEFEVIYLDQRDDGAIIQSALYEETGRKTVPSVWIGGVCIGGCDDTQLLHDKGELLKKIEFAKDKNPEQA